MVRNAGPESDDNRLDGIITGIIDGTEEGSTTTEETRANGNDAVQSGEDRVRESQMGVAGLDEDDEEAGKGIEAAELQP